MDTATAPEQLKPPNLARLEEYEIVAPDVETTGLHWYRDKIFGVAVAALTKEGVIRSGYWDIREQPRILEILKDKLPRCKKVVNHSIKFDAHFLLNEGIRLPDVIECTSVRAALINEHEFLFDLDHLARKYLDRGKHTEVYQQLADLFGGKPTRDAQMQNLHRAPRTMVEAYATPDPELAIRLWQWQQREIDKQELQRIWALERELTPILVDVERQGIRVNEDLSHKTIKRLNKTIGDAQSLLDETAGHPVNANSPPQMRALFGAHMVGERWETDDSYPLEKTPGGEASMTADVLRALAERGDKRAEAALTLRKMIKARSFLNNHVLGHAVGGRVYPNYNQTRGDNELGTGTGRFSVNDPALQQIPARDVDVAELVRVVFEPEEGQEWSCADWNQFEFRWFAHYVNSPKINKIYADNPDADFHQTLADMSGLPRSARFAGETANAKQINLGLVFGMGEGRMALEMGLDYSVRERGNKQWFEAGPKAQEIFAKYHQSVPGVQTLLNNASAIARNRGYVQTIMGRHLRFPNGQYHKAGGLVFQGSSADSMKTKFIELWKASRGKDWRLLLSVHDEADLSTPKKGGDLLRKEIKRTLECFDGISCPISCRIPIRCSINVGPNWWIASK